MSNGHGWPRAVVTLDATGRAEVNVAGVVETFQEETPDAVRSRVIHFIVQRALVLDRAIPASITEPRDHWEIIVHQDGTVTENLEASQYQGRPDDGALVADGAGPTAG